MNDAVVNSTSVETQVEVLKSENVAHLVIKKLNLAPGSRVCRGRRRHPRNGHRFDYEITAAFLHCTRRRIRTSTKSISKHGKYPKERADLCHQHFFHVVEPRSGR